MACAVANGHVKSTVSAKMSPKEKCRRIYPGGGLRQWIEVTP